MRSLLIISLLRESGEQTAHLVQLDVLLRDLVLQPSRVTAQWIVQSQPQSHSQFVSFLQYYHCGVDILRLNQSEPVEPRSNRHRFNVPSPIHLMAIVVSDTRVF